MEKRVGDRGASPRAESDGDGCSDGSDIGRTGPRLSRRIRASLRRGWTGLVALVLFCAVPGAVAVTLIGTDVRITDISLAGLDRDAIHSAVAYNGTAMEFLVVAEGDAVFNDMDEIIGRRVDALTGAPLGADIRISFMATGGFGGQAANPAVAYNGTANEYLVVWQGGTTNQDEIYGQRLDAAGLALGVAFQISNAAGLVTVRDAANPALAYNAFANEYLVVWQDGTGNIDEILGQRVAAAGTLIGTGTAISDIATTGLGRSAANPALAYNSTANTYQVVWEGNGVIADPGAEAIFGQMVLADGTPTMLLDDVIAAGRASRPDIAYNGVDNEHLVVFQSEAGPDSEIFGQRVDITGLAAGLPFRISDDNRARGPAVAHAGANNQYLIAWQGDLALLQQEVFGRLVTGLGSRLGIADTRITFTVTTAGPARDSALPAVAYDDTGNLFLVTYEADGLPDLVPGDNFDDVTEIFGQFTGPAHPDLSLVKDDGGVIASPGATVAYLLNFANIGAGPAPNAAVTETVPANTVFNAAASSPGWTCVAAGAAGDTCTIPVGTLVPGASGSVTFAVTVDTPFPHSVAELTNSATIADDTSGGADLAPANNTAVATTPVDAAPDLWIAKDDGGVTALPGDAIAYALTYGNAGDQHALGVAVTETVPVGTTFNAAGSTAGWSCSDASAAGTACLLTVGALDVVQGGTAVFSVTVDSLLPAGLDAVANSASIADDGANGADRNPADNIAADTTPVIASPDLGIVKDDGGLSTGPGGTIAYTLSYANLGVQGASGTAITESVPANTIFNAGASSAGWSCANGSPAATPCTLAVGTLAAGASGSAIFAVTVDNPVPAGVTEIANTATVGDDGTNGPDANPADNTGSDTTSVITLLMRADDLLAYIADAVADRSLRGIGRGRLAIYRLRIFTRQVMRARAQIALGKITVACRLLSYALVRTDRRWGTRDLVTGPAAAGVAAEIRQLQTRLGCTSFPRRRWFRRR